MHCLYNIPSPKCLTPNFSVYFAPSAPYGETFTVDALTPLQVVETFEKVCGRRFSIDFVAEDSLRAKWSGASDPIEKSFAGLMLYYTMGEAIDMTSALRWCPINLTPVRQIAAQA